MTKIILYAATSIDGYIADKNGNVDWLPDPNTDKDDVDHKGFLNSIQSIFMGRRSYEQILTFGKWAWPEKTTYVFTSKKLPANGSNIFFVHEPPEIFMQKFRTEKSNQNVWLLGGAELNKSFCDLNLIDECIITVVPVTLGDGIPLSISLNDFKLARIKKFQDNLVQKTYLKNNNSSNE